MMAVKKFSYFQKITSLKMRERQKELKRMEGKYIRTRVMFLILHLITRLESK